MPRKGISKLHIMRLGRKGHGQRDARELPPFHAPRAGKHSRIAGRGKHKARKGFA